MLDKLNVIMRSADLTAMQEADIDIASRVAKSADEVSKAVRDFGGDGWICCTGAVALVSAKTPLPASPILYGELANGDRSLHIRPHRDGWQLFTMTRKNGSGLCEEMTLAGRMDGKPDHRYEVFWRVDAQTGAYAPYASRFTGFGKEAKHG